MLYLLSPRTERSPQMLYWHDFESLSVSYLHPNPACIKHTVIEEQSINEKRKTCIAAVQSLNVCMLWMLTNVLVSMFNTNLTVVDFCIWKLYYAHVYFVYLLILLFFYNAIKNSFKLIEMRNRKTIVFDCVTQWSVMLHSHKIKVTFKSRECSGCSKRAIAACCQSIITSVFSYATTKKKGIIAVLKDSNSFVPFFNLTP